MKFLDIDVGNTRLKWRQSDTAGSVLRLGKSDESVVAELMRQLQGVAFDRVRVASVASAGLSDVLAGRFHAVFGIDPGFAVVSPEANGVVCAYKDVSRLGVDRWLAVLAAKGAGLTDALVVDCGSAVTIDLLQSGNHLGGYIVPGMRLMVESLFRDTDRVKVEAEAVSSLVPGCDTTQAVNRGVLLMILGLVEKVARSFIDDPEAGSSPVVVLTGGDAPAVFREMQVASGFDGRVILSPDLVMDGLQWSQLVSRKD